jgi:uncharacterized protein YdgA (DUF945 family)
MSRTHDVAWAAGFFDGEGFVTIQKRNTKAQNGKRYESYYLRIGVNHVAPEPLNELLRIFGGTLRKQNLHTVLGNRKPRHTWQLSCSQAKEALVQMMPYLRNKNKAAELGIELQNTMAQTKLETPLETQLYRKLLKDQLQTLNKMD